jgi:hypothetical protein
MRCVGLFVVVTFGACGSHARDQPPAPAKPVPVAVAGQLLPPAAFDGIADRVERSRALFAEIGKVLSHPRCVNCHTPDETPRQGDMHAIHDPPIERGIGDRGVAGMQCTGCHQDHNLELARVPGAPGWHLAPVTMVWLDRTPRQICEQIKDSMRNGGRTLGQIHEHLAHDPLVGWGWSPGADRVPAPGTQAELGALALAWIDSGAECPEDK